MSGTIYVDVDETQRQIVSTNHPGLSNIMIEMPRNAAYQNNYGQYFIPSNAIVPSGSRVTWVNNDYIAHTATGSDRLTFDTGPVLPSESKSFIINGTGRLAYFCEIHPWMQGSVEIISRR
jgi:plastocyanin